MDFRQFAFRELYIKNATNDLDNAAFAQIVGCCHVKPPMIVLVQPPRHKGTKYKILYEFLL
jgi:hypothetical protein